MKKHRQIGWASENDKRGLQRREELKQLAKARSEGQSGSGLHGDSTPKRKKQLQYLRSLLESPPQFDFTSEPIPSNSTLEEINEKRRELKYRLAWLQALVEMTEAELVVLEKAEVDKAGTSKKSVDCTRPKEPPK